MCSTRHRGRWIGALLVAGLVLLGAQAVQAEVLTLESEETASLMGWVYCDIDNDGVRDDEEIPIADVTIMLEGLTDDEQVVSQSQKTGTDGKFLFENLQPGTYSLAETQPERYVQGKHNPPGTAGGTADGPDHVTGIVLAAATEATDYLFGEYGLKARYISKKPFLVVVPEPATVWLALLGLPALCLMLRHRRGLPRR